MAMASSGRSPPLSREVAPDRSPSRLSRNRNKSVMGGAKRENKRMRTPPRGSVLAGFERI